MSMWATSFLKSNTYSIIFCFPEWIIKYDFFEKLLQLYTENAYVQLLGYYLTDYTVPDNFLVPHH